MIENFSITNLANIKYLKINNLSNINVFTGENDTGKTMILSVLYTLTKSLENLNRGDENKTFKEIISEKLYWTFQVNKLGDLVSKDREDKSEHCKIKITYR
ncbi:MAG: AAA family ATPase [Candidatus Marithrix sp.]